MDMVSKKKVENERRRIHKKNQLRSAAAAKDPGFYEFEQLKDTEHSAPPDFPFVALLLSFLSLQEVFLFFCTQS